MSDESIAARIEQLVSEEHGLHNREQVDNANPDALEADEDRLRAVEVELDRCWDLLRQRRALREFGRNPDEAEVRPAKIVEQNIPMHRLGTPDEVARIIYVLCTETGSYVNGAEIHINGGQHV